ncbi:hypothetical protein NDU88_002083 [Pleurodeles waltl]|uniref:Uncharacterized protein n=1 Tax=Pleurodeles waltl TaxID=8319 RepID=A0AAV7R901_PLEWA|nr:hypothetical protein NDU88_002083 [Pleurodeles waltl]
MTKGRVLWLGHNIAKYTTSMLANKERRNILIDYGCRQSVIKEAYVQPDQWDPNTQVLITCVHGDRETYPVATIEINWRGHEEYLSVGVIPELGEDMIIGTDYEAFPQLLNTANQDHISDSWWEEAPFVSFNIEGNNPIRKLSKAQKRKQNRLYQKETVSSKTPVPDSPKAIMSMAGQFQQAQREDPTLKNA